MEKCYISPRQLHVSLLSPLLTGSNKCMKLVCLKICTHLSCSRSANALNGFFVCMQLRHVMSTLYVGDVILYSI